MLSQHFFYDLVRELSDTPCTFSSEHEFKVGVSEWYEGQAKILFFRIFFLANDRGSLSDSRKTT
jgi:hypothetical protein